MAWFEDGLSSLSNLKGQITSFTKEVLSEGIVEEIDERSKELQEAEEKCVQLQELLNSKDAENDVDQDDDGGGYFWDPPSIRARDARSQNQSKLLQEQLTQATLRIRELEAELKKVQKVSATTGLKDEITDGHQKAELLRAKQDMVNRIIQMGEKSREAERNMKRLHSDEAVLVNDFRTIIAQLGSTEQLDLIHSALKALESENEKLRTPQKWEKSDSDEKIEKINDPGSDVSSLKANLHENSKERGDKQREDAYDNEIELRKKIAELQEENKNLTISLEELDQQHTESIEQVLLIKEEIQKKHQALQKAYEQLYVDFNESQYKVEALEAKLASAESNNNKIVEEQAESNRSEQKNMIEFESREIQTEFPKESESPKEEISRIDELSQKIKDILKSTAITTNKDESIFEAVAKHYVEAKWKKDVLERKVTELTRELKQTSEMKDSLQVECDDMQTNIESLLLEIQHLKSNLPSIPEASEERVATLETETESLYEEIKRLQAENSNMREKNSELMITMQNVEASLKNQNNLKEDVRNARQQLDIAKQNAQESYSTNVENTESMVEDLTRKLHASLEKNNELRKKIDRLEDSEKQTQEQLRMSLDRCKGLDENIELIEELKLDLENARRELKSSIANRKQLEHDIAILQETKHEDERDIEVLSHEKEQLEAELSMLRQSGSSNENSELLTELRKQLEGVTKDRDDLEYDILEMRKELDKALAEIELRHSETLKLQEDKERLIKENNSLLDQLTATHDESLDKVELLSTEMSLLQQEHATLKEEAAATKSELCKISAELQEATDKRTLLEQELSSLKSHAEKLASDNETLRAVEENSTKLAGELEIAKNFKEQWRSAEEKRIQLESELSDVYDELCSKKQELSSLKSAWWKLEEQESLANSKQQASEHAYTELEAEFACLRKQNEEMSIIQQGKANDEEKEERQRLIQELEEKQREIDILNVEKNELATKLAEEHQIVVASRENSKEAAGMARETIESLSQLIREKDNEIQNLKTTTIVTANQANAESEKEMASLRHERDELVKLVQIKHNESVQYHAEIQRLTQLLNEQISTIQKLMINQEENEKIVKEKAAEILWAQNELQVVRQKLKNYEESNNYGETCGIVEHSAQIAQAAILNEKCNALEAALIQEQSNTRLLQNQLTESQSKELNAAKELERLRTHLVEMEASYTEEAVLAEENRKELEAKLVQAEEKAKNSSTVYTSASIRANQQVETLQQQMALIIQQRDDIQNKLSAAEDKVLSHTASLTNLQIVLEQFQRDKEKDIIAATRKIQQQLNDSYKKQEELSTEILNLKDQLTEAKECLKAASRLSEQLDKKTERIEQLTQEVARLTELVNTADERIQEAKKSGEGKVDKALVKNLLMGYITSSTTDKSSVLRVFSTILNFNEAEKDKAGLNTSAGNSGWFGGLLSGGATAPTKDQEASLSAAFVKFLETESKPKPQLPPLTISSTSLSRPGHSRQHSSSSTHSTLLLSNVSLPTFPDFVPARNTGSILKEVLKDS
ncbi:thyroid receptor-interacting protein 11 isoform X2 [Cephus cinctus]|uniref:Thyroid receptor-interacting protein 11 isoform X2 n=1 Tax=Cephus cinctus TaxID=211228 RepID=A0AAJ7RW44_CEPCN|nr:thyroid receptor-interacting protein 11 isoform X2 [Cephus cinctus]